MLEVGLGMKKGRGQPGGEWGWGRGEDGEAAGAAGRGQVGVGRRGGRRGERVPSLCGDRPRFLPPAER